VNPATCQPKLVAPYDETSANGRSWIDRGQRRPSKRLEMV
jgi:hypothetical protein